MRDDLFSGFSEAGWDAAPWDSEPTFTPDELQILLNPALSAAEAAERSVRRTPRSSAASNRLNRRSGCNDLSGPRSGSTGISSVDRMMSPVESDDPLL